MSLELKIWLHNNPYDLKSEAKPHSDAILQQLLQNKLNTSSQLKIFKNTNGKPYIREPVYFSHSNSRNLYAYILSTQTEVAIDIEWIRPQHDFMKLANRYFHGSETALLSQLSGKIQQLKFYQMWTQKEAWCKLDGGNLWSYLNRPISDHQIDLTNKDKVHLIDIIDIDGFTGTVASRTQINNIWINNIAYPCTN